MLGDAKRRLTFTGAGRTYVPKSATFRTEPSAQFTLVSMHTKREII